MIGSPLARHASRPPNTTRRIWPASRSCLSGAGSCHHYTTSDRQRQVPDWKGEVVEHSGPHVLGHGTEKERDEAERRGSADWPTVEESEKPHCAGGLQCPQHPQSRRRDTQLRGVLQDECRRRKVGERMPILATMAEAVSTDWGLMASYSASCVAESPEHLRNRASYRSAADSQYRSPLPASAAQPCAYGTGDLGLFGEEWPIGGSFSP